MRSVSEAIKVMEERFAGRMAYTDVYGVERTYEDLLKASQAFAKSLLALGMRRGDHLALWMPNRFEWLVVELACACLGVPVVNLNTRYKKNEVEYILRDSDARMLVCQTQLLKIDFVGLLETIIPELRESPCGALTLDSFPMLRYVVALGDPSPSWSIPYTDMMTIGSQIDEKLYEDLQSQVGPSDVMNIFYTSGTTSFPKGAMQTQRSLVQHSYEAMEHLGLTAGDRHLVIPPFCGITGFNLALGTLLHGATVVTMDVFEPTACLRLMEKERVTDCVGFDSMFDELVAVQRKLGADVSSLARGGAAVMGRPVKEALEEYEAVFGCPFISPYGLSEANALLLVASPSDPFESRARAGGRLVGRDKEVRIFSLENDCPVSEGEVGEIRIRGFNVMKGYYKVVDASRQSVTDDGWLRTGDLGVQEGPFYYYLGRLKDILKVRGFTFSPVEVEEVINMHEAVEFSQVVGVSTGPGEDLVVGCVRLKKPEGNLSSLREEIIQLCRDRLASFKVPREILFVSEFPVTSTGQAGNKVRKVELREWVKRQLNLKGTEM